MYHIVNDKRAKKSADLICKTLSECLEEKPYNKIKINDICKKCNVSRSTFYRLFDTIDDVLAYECDSIRIDTDKALETIQFNNKNEKVVYCIECWLKHKTMIKVIVENKMIDVLYDSFTRNSSRLMELYSVHYEDETQKKCFISLMASLIFATTTIYFESNSDYSIENVFKNVCTNTNIIISQWQDGII